MAKKGNRIQVIMECTEHKAGAFGIKKIQLYSEKENSSQRN